jgi:hypothetical protein
VAKALEIDTTPMVLDGPHFFPAPAPYAPPFDATSYLDDNAHQIRKAQGGVPPYQYSSSNTEVASVDKDTGQVVSMRNGIARINVSDRNGGNASYEVTCENVYELVYSSQPRNHAQAMSWLASIGARPFPGGLSPEVDDPTGKAASFSFQKLNGPATQYWYSPYISNVTGLPYASVARVSAKEAQWQTKPYVGGISAVGANWTGTDNNQSIGYRSRSR